MAKENDELKKKNEQLEEQVKDYELKLDEKVKGAASRAGEVRES